MRDLAIATLVPSANDAATALAVHVGGGSVPRFVGLMNAKARSLGLTSTHFENPHGLDQPGHVSSARDVTTLLSAALRNPFIRTWSARPTATIAGGRTLTSTDGLIGKLPLVGAKTGHTNDAGWSQVAAAERNGVRITASVLGSPSEAQRDTDLAALLTWGLAQYHPVKAVGTRVYARAETGYGRPPVELVAPAEIVRNVRVGRPLVERVVVSSSLALPVTRGGLLGKLPLVGAKTGHTNDAGWSQVAAAERNGVRITASVLGSPSEAQRDTDLAALLTWGLAQYHPVEAVATRVYARAETGYGRQPVELVAPGEIVRNVRVGRPLVERVVVSSALALPVTRGQRVGEVKVFADGRLIARAPLVAAASVPAVGAPGKVAWYARRTV